METVVEDKIRGDPELASAVDHATALLERELGQSRDLVSAEWSLARDEQGRPLIDLKLSDPSGSIVGRFARVELSDPRQMGIRFHRLWGDLLQKRAREHLERARQLLGGR